MSEIFYELEWTKLLNSAYIIKGVKNTLATNKKYLRTIYQLTLQDKKVRQINLALSLGYAYSSVFIIIKHLRKDGLIIIKNNNIFLTF
ncbi:MAG: hypothetical protein ACLR9T_02720 [Thomasclavelia sp.]|uniref:hypothetical protein n=1 Tax=Thomasclavelia sp. TaxID=3025757 RepID=UPI00399F34DC